MSIGEVDARRWRVAHCAGTIQGMGVGYVIPFVRDEQLARAVEAGEQHVWDIVVIGGGATGVGIAVDAASRDYSVLLLERPTSAKALVVVPLNWCMAAFVISSKAICGSCTKRWKNGRYCYAMRRMLHTICHSSFRVPVGGKRSSTARD